MVNIRPEAGRDRAAIRTVHEAAFETSTEADLVEALRGTDAWIPELSLVAEDETGVIGHLLITVARLDSGPEVLALAPMAVEPGRQARGIGSALVRDALARCAETSYPILVVLGHPTYYPRFGFRSARALGITAPFDVPDEAWMALPLPAHHAGLRGTLVYPPPFSAA